MTTGRRLTIWLATILGVVLIAGVVLFSFYEQRLGKQATGHLRTMLMLRESVLRSHFESLRSEVALWSSRAIVVDLLSMLVDAHAADDADTLSGMGSLRTSAIDTVSESRDDVALDVRIREFTEHHGYYDVFFIGPDGDVLFTMAKESDYGTNLVDGPYADTGLGSLFQTLRSASDDVIAFEDFSLYPPSNNQPAAFLGARVVSNDRFLGVYAIQIPETTINHIMQFSAGMGESGETYLVGEDGLMRSTSRFFDSSTVLKTPVEGATVSRALAGEEGIEVVDDYRGIPVYSAYRPFDFEGTRWAVLAEQDVAEVEQPVRATALWLTGAFVVLCIVVALLRMMLVRIVLPTALVAFFGLSAMQLDDD